MGARANRGRRAAIVDGVRTPFGRQGGAFRHLTAVDLGRMCVAELVQRAGLDQREIDQVVFGRAVRSIDAPDIAREIALRAGLPAGVEAYTVSEACVTGYRTLVAAVDAIDAGTIDCAVVGGADSVSDAPMTVSRRLADALGEVSRAHGLAERLHALADVRPRDLVPHTPTPPEPVTGPAPGESAERLAQAHRISRREQDELAFRSHELAARARAEGRLDEAAMTAWLPPDFEPVVDDETVRRDISIDALAALPPAIDARYGTITAGNGATLADGASALAVMREDKARALGHAPIGFVRAHAFAAVDPDDQPLMAPAFAVAAALERARAALGDVALIDLHEAYAVQVLAVVRAFESETFARRALGRGRRLGNVDRERLNVAGGSIAYGHPPAATGGRQIAQTLYELRHRRGGLALCAAGGADGLGAALLLEVE